MIIPNLARDPQVQTQNTRIMLAKTFKLTWIRFAGLTLLASVGLLLASCAHDQPPLIADPATNRDSTMPWNQQEKWEQGGQAAELNTAGRR